MHSPVFKWHIELGLFRLACPQTPRVSKKTANFVQCYVSTEAILANIAKRSNAGHYMGQNLFCQIKLFCWVVFVSTLKC